MNFANPYIMYIAVAAVFICLFIIMAGVIQAFANYQKRRETISKIKHTQNQWAKVDVEESGEPVSFFNRLVKALSSSGSKLSGGSSEKYSAGRLRFLRAGIVNPEVSSIYWGTKVWLPIIFIGSFVLLRMFVFKLITLRVSMGIAVASGLFGFYLPEIFLYLKANYRRSKIDKGLPDALDLLVVCVEAGLGLDSAFKRVADEMALTEPQLSSEFKLLNLEQRAGMSRTIALRNLALRVNLDSLNSLITLVVQTDKFGTSVVKALKVFANSFRTKRFQIAEEKAAKLPVKMLIPLIFFIFPAFLVVLVGPSIIEVYEKFILR